MAIRIIGGQYRGKKITVYHHPELRPTSDKIRETVFNWLMHDIQGATCLDLFAGSGALGLEAFSRGAQSVIFIEKNKKIFQQLQKTITSWTNPALKCFNQDGLLYLKTCTIAFDMIFLDPPFQSNLLDLSLTLLKNSPMLKPDTRLYIESTLSFPIPSDWVCFRSKKAGQVKYGLYTQDM